MISFEEALNTVLSHSAAWDHESVPLEEAAGRVLAEAVSADREYPPFNRATMDGYAVKSDDIIEKRMTRFRLIGELYAGSGTQFTLRSGEALKIMTGAPVPDTADAVIKKEDAEEGSGFVTFRVEEFAPRQCVARKGEDIRSGAAVISRPVQISPAHLSVLASLGKTDVRVVKRPRVALISTGNEIRSVKDPVAEYQIRDANRYSIEGFLNNYSIQPVCSAIVPDEIAPLTQMIESVISSDLIILSGGVSAGDADLVPEALSACGVTEVFHKVKIKPGKPLWFGRHPNGVRVFALPGNPYSVQAACRLFIDPYVRACFGLPAAEPLVVPLRSARKKKVSFDEFFPAKISNAGGIHAEHLAYHTSGDITATLEADGVGHHPASAADLKSGEPVHVYLWKNIR